MVTDVSPSIRATDGHTVAYACDIAKRTRTAGPLDEHSVEFDIAVVRAAMDGPSKASPAERRHRRTQPA